MQEDTSFDDLKNVPLSEFDNLHGPIPKLRTTCQLYDYVMQSDADNNLTATIPIREIAHLIYYAQGIAVKQVCDKHNAIMTDVRSKARALRYHHMAEAILPKTDIIHDGRYGDSGEFADWETIMTVEEA